MVRDEPNTSVIVAQEVGGELDALAACDREALVDHQLLQRIEPGSAMPPTSVPVMAVIGLITQL